MPIFRNGLIGRKDAKEGNMRQFRDMRGRIFAAVMVVVTLLSSISVSIMSSAENEGQTAYEYGTVASGGSLAQIYQATGYTQVNSVSLAFHLDPGKSVDLTVKAYQNLTNPVDPTSGVEIYSGTQKVSAGAIEAATDIEQQISFNKTIVLTPEETMSIVVKVTSSDGQVATFRGTKGTGTEAYTRASDSATWIGTEIAMMDIATTGSTDNAVPNDITFSVTPAAIVADKSDTTPIKVDITPAYKRKIEYTSDKQFIQVNDDGTVSYEASGKGQISVKVVGSTDIKPIDVTVLESELDKNQDLSYDGTPKKPTVTVKCGDDTLTQGTHYDVTYQNNTNVGTATAVIEGKANTEYAGYSHTLTFTIEQKQITSDMLKDAAFGINTTTGEVISATGIKDGDYELVLGKDFTTTAQRKGSLVEVEDGLSYLTYMVTVTGIGNYASSEVLTKDQKIFSSNGNLIDISDLVSIELNQERFTYNGEAYIPTVTLKAKDGSNLGDAFRNCCSIRYVNNKNAGTARVVVKGKEDCGLTGTVEKEFDIQKLSIANQSVKASLSSKKYRHTGNPIRPSVDVVLTVGDTEIPLTENEDYTVSYINNEDITTPAMPGRVILTGVGNFKGSTELTFDIIGNLDTEASIDIRGKVARLRDGKYVSDYSDVYDGTEKKPLVNIELGDNVLEEEVDYTADYLNNTAAGTATIKITGKGVYQGQSTEVTFTITPAMMNGSMQLSTDSFVYTGSPITIPEDEITLSRGILGGTYSEEDYDLSYSNNTNVGKATVTATGKGNYRGTITGTFRITPLPLTDGKIEVSYIKDHAYTGNNIHPTVTVLLNGVAVDTKYYTVEYGGDCRNIGQGTGKITITGQGNLSGSKDFYFNILAKSIAGDNMRFVVGGVTAIKEDGKWKCAYEIPYTGVQQSPSIEVYDGSYQLRSLTDYTIFMANAINAGETAVIRVTGQGNYSGSEAEIYFTIAPKDITNDPQIRITDLGTMFEKDDYFLPNVSVQDLAVIDSKRNLVKDVDYIITAKDDSSKTAGEKRTAIITGQGNYTGTREVTYKVGDTLSDAKVQLFNPKTGNVYRELGGTWQVEYLGTTLYPTSKLTIGDKELVERQDYEVTARQSNVGDLHAAKFPNADITNIITVTYTGKGMYFGTKQVQYIISPVDISNFKVTDDNATHIYDGKVVTPNPTVKYILGEGEDVIATLKQDTDYSLSVTKIGPSVTTAKVEIIGKGNYTGTLTQEYEIRQKNISDADVTVDRIPDQPYTGMDITPGVVLRYNGMVLTTFTDYTAEYSDNKNSGTAHITITGTGNYTGTKTVRFEIVKRNLKDAYVTLIGETEFRYDGTKKKPGVLVTYNGNQLVEDQDYELEYQENTAPGQASVIVRGMGNYEGTVTRNFTIWGDLSDTSKFNIVLPKVDGAEREFYTLSQKNGTYVLNLQESEVLVQRAAMDGGLESANLVRGQDYEITFENCDRIGTGIIHITGTGNYIRNYQAKEIRIKGDLSTATPVMPQSSYDYTGEEITPIPNLVFGADERSLSQDVEVEYAYTNHTNVGTGVLKITPKQDSEILVGQKTVNFAIRYNLTTAEITGVDPDGYDYKGEAIKPEVTVICAGKELTKNSDYTVSYGTNTMAGENVGTITISPVDSKSIGERVIRFTINGKDIAEQTLAVKGADWNSEIRETYTGNPIPPEVTVRDSKSAKLLTANTDYTVSYRNNTDVGDTATIIVRGVGGYYGEITKTFTITPVNIGDTAVIKEISSANYAGSAPVYPTIKLTYNGRTLTGAEEKDGELPPANCDYTYTVTDNTTVTDRAKVTITGKGNFTGSDTQTFTINKTNLANGSISIPQASTVYTGKTITLDEIAKHIVVTCPVGNGDLFTLEKDRHYSISCTDTIKNAGRYAITIGASDTNFTGSLQTFFTVEQKPLDADDIIVEEIPEQPYTTEVSVDGATPKVKVTYRIIDEEGDVFHEETLKEGTDYTVSYRDNKAAGKATAVIRAVDSGNYTGKREVAFFIGKNIANVAEASLNNYPESGYTYDLREHMPGVTVTNQEGKKLVKDRDYTVSYEEDVINAGTKVITITGIGEYYGTITETYDINKRWVDPANLTLTLEGLEEDENGYYAIYNGAPVVPGVKLFDKTLGSYLKDSDYDVVIYGNDVTSTEGNPAHVIVTTKDSSGNYVGRIVVSQEFEIRSRDLATLEPEAVITLSLNGKTVKELEFTGEALEPEAAVRFGDVELVKNRDYTVSYENNVKVGKAKVIITGTRNYSGTLEKEFVIWADLSKDYVQVSIDKQFCTGKPLTPPVGLFVGGDPVDEEYYKVVYSSSDNYRTKGHVTIFANPEKEGASTYYRGQCDADFEIGFDGDALRITGYADKYVYTGMPIEPEFSILTPSGDQVAYRPEEVVYQNVAGGKDHTNVGRIKATVPIVVLDEDGRELYQDTKDVEFEIIPKNINACSINYLKTATYVGRELQIPVVIVYNSKELTQGQEYNLVYSDNINPGYGTALVSGIGNFTGTSALRFEIQPPTMIGLQASPLSTNSIELSWKRNGAATGYQIYSGDVQTLYGVATGTNFVASNLLPHTQYTFKVRSYVQVGDQISFGPFETVSGYTLVGSVSMNGFSNASRSATLVWTRDLSIDGYQIYRSTAADGEYKMVAAMPNSQVSYTDWALTSGATYYYKVRAYKWLGDGFQYGSLSAPIAITVR